MSTESTYPETRQTWIVQRLSEGAHAEVRTLLMELYVEPLRTTCRRCLGLSAEAALDLVHGFFASRLGRPDYFAAWARSGLRLRHWLWNGVCYFAREQRRSDRRMTTVSEMPDQTDATAPDPGQEFDRSFAVALVRAAMQRAEAACCAEGFADHWQIFARHSAGETLAALARAFDLTPNQALVRLRPARRRFEAALVELLVADGVPAAEVPRAIRELVESG